MPFFAQADFVEPVTVLGDAERRCLAYGGSLMLLEFRFPGGSIVPEHAHPHEQIGYVVSGEIDFMIEGQAPKHLYGGGSYYVPANARHSVTVQTDAVLIDCFTPIREDYVPG